MSGSCSCDPDTSDGCAWCSPHPGKGAHKVELYPAPTAEESADVRGGGLPGDHPALPNTSDGKFGEFGDVTYVDSHVRTLRGEEYEAYEEFRSAARALRAAGEAQRLALERYKAALERHSEMACKVDR